MLRAVYAITSGTLSPAASCLPPPQVSFTPQIVGEAAKPQQAMLMAVSKASGGLAAYAVAKAKKDGSQTASLSTAAIEKQIANVVSARATCSWVSVLGLTAAQRSTL